MSTAARLSRARMVEELRAHERELRAYAKRERAEQRRSERLQSEPFTPSPAEQRRLDRSGARMVKQVRRLTERALRAMAVDRWDDVLSDLIDAAAILHNGGGCLTPSRAGYEVIAAKELDYILTFVDEQVERGCRPAWGDLPEDRAERRARRAA